VSIAAAEMIWLGVAAYLVVGAAFAGWMLAGAIKRLDPLAAAAPWRVKLLIAPGLAALWPVMAAKLARAPS
jgi:hypothetical protein